MKALPEYLENILNHMAVCEEKNGGMKKEEAYALYKKELIDESLTAKANPTSNNEELIDATTKFYKAISSFFFFLFLQQVRPATKTDLLKNLAPVLEEIQSHGLLSFKLFLQIPVEKRNEIIKEVTSKLGRTIVYFNYPKTYNDHLKMWNLVKNYTLKYVTDKAETPDGFEELYMEMRNLNIVSQNPQKSVQAVVDDLISKGFTAKEIHIYMKNNNYHASIKALEDYIKKNPRLSEGKSFMDFDQKQLAMGTQVEMEHTDNVQEAQRIAMDHLTEDKDYYKKLALMEAGALDASINPTIKAFHEIYTAAGERFANSFLGKKLGYRFRPGKEALEKIRDESGKLLPEPKKYHSSKQKAGIDRKLKLEKVYGKKDGKEQWFDKKHYEPVDPALLNSDGYKFFETLRNFSNNTGEAILRCFYGEKTKRPLKTLNKGWANHASGEYYKNEMLTKGEIRDDAERSRYMQLMVSSIVFATIEPLFDLTPAKLDKLLDTMMKKYPANKWNDTKTRQAFVKDVLDYIKNKGQL